MQETWAQSLIQEDPTCLGSCTTTCALEPRRGSSWAPAPWSLRSATETPPQWEACTQQLEKSPTAPKTQHGHKYINCENRILEQVAIPSSGGSSWPRDQTRVSCIAGRFFIIWATREAVVYVYTCMYVYVHVHTYMSGSLCCTVEANTWQPTPVFLPGESHGWRSLVGCYPWGHTESDTTEAT